MNKMRHGDDPRVFSLVTASVDAVFFVVFFFLGVHVRVSGMLQFIHGGAGILFGGGISDGHCDLVRVHSAPSRSFFLDGLAKSLGIVRMDDGHELVAAGPVCFTLVGHGKCNAVRCTLDELIACGMSRYQNDKTVAPVFERADENMYKNKNTLKATKT